MRKLVTPIVVIVLFLVGLALSGCSHENASAPTAVNTAQPTQATQPAASGTQPAAATGNNSQFYSPGKSYNPK